MKQTIFIAAIACIVMIACNPLKPDQTQATTTSFNAADSITSPTAQNMVTHYSDPVVDKSIGPLIKHVSLHNSDLHAIFKEMSKKSKPVTRIRLLEAAYLDTDSIVARRNQLTVLLQLKVGYNSNYYYYDVRSLGDGRLCPPPMGCSTEQ
jgi:hypothetical protein